MIVLVSIPAIFSIFGPQSCCGKNWYIRILHWYLRPRYPSLIHLIIVFWLIVLHIRFQFPSCVLAPQLLIGGFASLIFGLFAYILKPCCYRKTALVIKLDEAFNDDIEVNEALLLATNDDYGCRYWYQQPFSRCTFILLIASIWVVSLISAYGLYILLIPL